MNTAIKVVLGTLEIGLILVSLFFVIPAAYAACMIVYKFMLSDTIRVWGEMIGGILLGFWIE